MPCKKLKNIYLVVTVVVVNFINVFKSPSANYSIEKFLPAKFEKSHFSVIQSNLDYLNLSYPDFSLVAQFTSTYKHL